MTSDFRQQEVSQALAGDAAALTRLVRVSTPVIQARVARSLLLRRQGGNSGRDIRQEVEDLTQEVFLALFADDGRMLRGWQPERGLSLEGFVGLVAERQVASILRSGKRSPWREDPTLPEVLDEIADGREPEALVASREEMRRLLDRLTEELSPLGQRLFKLLFLEELSIDDATRQTGLSADALYAWRSRLRRLCRRLLAEMSDRAPGGRKTPMDVHA